MWEFASPYSDVVRGDGDGWVVSEGGGHFWGRHGAAGLLLRAPGPDGTFAVLLQHRAPWSHQGGTWALPGGARDSHESVEEAAVREALEETGVQADLMTVRTTVVTHEVPGWSYTTVIADATEQLREFLYSKVYPRPGIDSAVEKSKELLRQMAHWFLSHPEDLHARLKHQPPANQSLKRTLVDYLAGMTDEYAISLFQDLFVPHFQLDTSLAPSGDKVIGRP